MANLKKQFEKFHKSIKVEFGELREKRDIILDKIKRYIADNNIVVPELINQGSYIYGVGIKPVYYEQEYDIDVGLDFKIKSDDYTPSGIRSLILKAVQGHTKSIEGRKPCIRVRYERGYHIDLVCYARYKHSESHEQYQLAHLDNGWVDSDPKRLKLFIEEARVPFTNSKDHSGSDQLQRVVRFLKRWNDLVIQGESDDKPTGLAILLYCIKALPAPVYDSQGNSDDLQALINIAEKAKYGNKIPAYKPDTKEDVFGKISYLGMTKLISRFQKLYKALLDARNSDQLLNACNIMRGQFGDDFPLEGISNDIEKKKTLLSSAAASSYANRFKPFGKTE